MSAVAAGNGIAQVFGDDEDEQARQIIEHAAHRDARDGLREPGRAMDPAVRERRQRPEALRRRRPRPRRRRPSGSRGGGLRRRPW
ncbi:MAG: hypothetical protein ACFN04_02965, partial [Propionibacterium acidifaciens]